RGHDARDGRGILIRHEREGRDLAGRVTSLAVRLKHGLDVLVERRPRRRSARRSRAFAASARATGDRDQREEAQSRNESAHWASLSSVRALARAVLCPPKRRELSGAGSSKSKTAGAARRINRAGQLPLAALLGSHSVSGTPSRWLAQRLQTKNASLNRF